jgi:hypothetical protein
LGVSSFFILNSASYFSHILTTLYGVLFAIFASRYAANGSSWYAVLAGACIGLMGLTRTANSLIFVIPFVASLAMSPPRRIGLIWFGLGGAPFLLALMTYNQLITGDSLVTVQALKDSSLFGWPTVNSLNLTVERLVELAVWTSPILLLGYIAAFILLIVRRRLNFVDWLMPITIIFFLFYEGDGGNQYGPRYYFEAWPFAVLTCLKAADDFLFSTKHTKYAAWLSAAVVASLMFEIAYLPARLEREHDVVVSRKDIYAKVKSAALKNSIVIISSGTADGIRKMGPRDLLRNGAEIDRQNVIYAVDIGSNNDQLVSFFKDRNVYVYSNGQLEPYGKAGF